MSNRNRNKTPEQILEEYHKRVMDKLISHNQELLHKSQAYIQDLANSDNCEQSETKAKESFDNLATKLGNIYSDINEIVSHIDSLIVEIDEKSVNLTPEEEQRIKNEKQSREMFNAFCPYFIMYNLLKQSVDTYESCQTI